MNSRLFVGSDASFNGKLFSSGLLIANGGLSVTGTVTLPAASISDSALSTNIATLTATQTLTNKTLTTPIISSISNSGTITIPTGTLTLSTLTGSETLTNKTLTTSGLLTALSDASLNSRLFVGSDASFNGKLFVTGNLTVNGNITGTYPSGSIPSSAIIGGVGSSNFTTDVSINQRLIVLGDTSMNSRLFIGSNLNLSGNAYLRGNVILDNGFILGKVSTYTSTVLNPTTTNYNNTYVVYTFTNTTNSSITTTLTLDSYATKFGCLCVGGGAGGSTSISTNWAGNSHGGGGGGQAVLSYANCPTVGTPVTITVTVGGGGIGTTAISQTITSTNIGGNSSISFVNSGTTYTMTGIGGGTTGLTSNLSNYGTTSSSNLTISGYNGGPGRTTGSNGSISADASAVTITDLGITNSILYSGGGSNLYYGGGGSSGGGGSGNNSAGGNGTSPGAGGGVGYATTGTYYSGGNGAGGIVQIWVQYNPTVSITSDTGGIAKIDGTAIVTNDLSINNRLLIGTDASVNNRLFIGSDSYFNGQTFLKGNTVLTNSIFSINRQLSYTSSVLTPTITTYNNTYYVYQFTNTTNSSASTTFTLDTNVSKFGCLCVGGGAGGSVVTLSNYVGKSHGGGGGGQAVLTYANCPTVTGPVTITVTIGGGGLGTTTVDATVASTNIGGNSSISFANAGTTYTMTGIGGGTTGITSNLSNYGTTSSSNLSITGYNGGPGRTTGSSGAISADASAVTITDLGITSTILYSGGGSNVYYGGPGSSGGGSSIVNAGGNGTSPGAGGGASYSTTATAYAGGNGAGGIVQIWVPVNSGSVQMTNPGASMLQLNGGAILSSDASFNSRLFVAGNVSLNSRLTVGGASYGTASNALTVNGGITLSNNSGGQSINGTNATSFMAWNFATGSASTDLINSAGPPNAGGFTFWNTSATTITTSNSNLLMRIQNYPSIALGIGKNPTYNLDVSGNLYISTDALINSRLFIGGDLSVNGNVNINGSVTVPTPISSDNSQKVATTAYVKSALSALSGSSSSFAGDVSINNRLFVGSDVSFGGNLFINKKVGIGISNPLSSLHVVAGNTTTNGIVYIENPENTTTNYGNELRFIMRTNPTTTFTQGGIGTSRESHVGNYSGSLLLYASMNGTNGEVMRLTSSKYVGINTTNPTSTLDVSGNVISRGLLTANTGLSVTGTVTLPTSSISDSALSTNITTLTGTQTLTNKTLTSPVISSISNSGTITIPTGTLTLATLTGTETLTNKTITTSGLLTALSDASINNRLFVGSDASMGGKLFVNSDASLNSRLFVAGDASMGGNLAITKNISVSGIVFQF